jgi:hypothetical protein
MTNIEIEAEIEHLLALIAELREEIIALKKTNILNYEKTNNVIHQ